MYESIKTAVTTRQAAETFGLTVNRSGMAACPFHDDHIPSLKLDQRYYCFGCGATGDVIDFMVPNLMRKATQFVGARKSIGKGAGENASQKEKISDGMLVLGALTSWALEGSVVTGDSMRARGYGTARRSSFMIYRMTGQDWELLASMLFLLILVSVFHNNACALRSANRYDAVSPPDKESCNQKNGKHSVRPVYSGYGYRAACLRCALVHGYIGWNAIQHGNGFAVLLCRQFCKIGEQQVQRYLLFCCAKSTAF